MKRESIIFVLILLIGFTGFVLAQDQECTSYNVACASDSRAEQYFDDEGCEQWRCVPIDQVTTCPVGCICEVDVGGTSTTKILAMICPTEQEPVETTIVGGTSTTETLISIIKEDSNLKIKSGDVEVVTSEKVFVENSELYVYTSKDIKQIKSFPEEAVSSSKIETLINIELIEENEKLVYHIFGTSKGKFLFIFPVTLEIKTIISAETGEVIDIDKPWWAFLASEI